MIQLTEKAITAIKEIAESEGLALSIRVKVLGGGCVGMKNDLFFDEIVSDMDEIIVQDSINILVDQISLQYLEGSTIDYIKSDFVEGFKILNPNVKSSCGCGQSQSY